MKRTNLAVIYARVSSKEQAEGYSVPAQLDLLNGYARKHGYRVERVFTEAETAKQAGRKAFRQMLAFLKEHPDVKVVLVEKTDRIYRNFQDYVALDVDAMGLELHLVKEGEILSKESRSHQKLIHRVKVVMAQNYVDNLSEEVVKGLDEKAKQGLWPTYAPFGYANDLGQHTIAPHPDEAPAVVKLFEMAATGNYNLNALRKAVFDVGVQSRRTKRILCKQEVSRILRNPIYMGDFLWKGKLFHGKHKPLVSVDLFDRANIVMGLKSRPKKNKHNFAFTGMVKCGHCGASLTAERQKGKHTYYRCAKQCENVVYLPENKLALQLGDALRRIKLTPEIVEWTREALLSSHADQAEHHRATVARLNARKEKLTSYLDQAYTDRLEGRIPEEMWQRRSAEWEIERAEIARQLAGLDTAKTNYLASGVKLLELAQRAHELYVSQSPHEQRRLLNVVVSNCSLRDGTVRYDLRKPFDLLADVSESDNWRRARDSKPAASTPACERRSDPGEPPPAAGGIGGVEWTIIELRAWCRAPRSLRCSTRWRSGRRDGCCAGPLCQPLRIHGELLHHMLRCRDAKRLEGGIHEATLPIADACPPYARGGFRILKGIEFSREHRFGWLAARS